MPAPGRRVPRGVRPKIENPGQVMNRLMKYVFHLYGFRMILVFICIFISVLANLRGTMFMQTLIDNYIEPLVRDRSHDFSGLLRAMLTMAAWYGIGIAAAFAYNRIMVNITQGTLLRMRKDLFNHMESLPVRYFDTHSHGDIMSVYTNDVDTLRQMISQSIPQLFSSAITLVGVLVSMIILSPVLTLVTLVMVAMIMLVTKKISAQSGKYFLKQQNDIGVVNGYIEEMMSGQKVVKVFSHEAENIARFDELNDQLFDSANNANKYANILMPANAQMGNVSYVVCTVVGAFLVLFHLTGMTVGKLVAFLQYNKSFNMPISQVSMQLNAIIMALAGADRIFRMLDEEPEADAGYVTLVRAKKNPDGSITETNERTGHWAWRHQHQADGTVEYRPQQGAIVMDHVDFGYVKDKQVLFDVSIEAKPGQKIAFVGSTGAGKTTITNLINRFYDIQDGKIRYDGININKIRKGDLRRSLGLVLQETHLFSMSVMENIRYGRLDATDEECIAAAKLANADTFIRQLPEGYQTVLTGDGANLSQGQRQLLAIARAAVANPPALILDEATSSIDTRTEKQVTDGMDRLMKGRTTFVIAHRLSTVKNSDCIMVLEHGHVIEKGNHEELIAKKGRYYQLYTGHKA